mmetsp:Transcript_7021/g.16923  ORF Transcript_7021/g.16923 Transcript_7021/m.16923 type:complete len:152 (+) Transcript_7021:1358-1813(+)
MSKLLNHFFSIHGSPAHTKPRRCKMLVLFIRVYTIPSIRTIGNQSPFDPRLVLLLGQTVLRPSAAYIGFGLSDAQQPLFETGARPRGRISFKMLDNSSVVVFEFVANRPDANTTVGVAVVGSHDGSSVLGGNRLFPFTVRDTIAALKAVLQ